MKGGGGPGIQIPRCRARPEKLAQRAGGGGGLRHIFLFLFCCCVIYIGTSLYQTDLRGDKQQKKQKNTKQKQQKIARKNKIRPKKGGGRGRLGPLDPPLYYFRITLNIKP